MLIGVTNMDFSMLNKNYHVPGLGNEPVNGNGNGVSGFEYIL